MMSTKSAPFVCAVLVATTTLCACSAHTGAQPANPLSSNLTIPSLTNDAIGFTGSNLVADSSFERPIVPPGTFQEFTTGQSFSSWRVVGVFGSVDLIGDGFNQNGFTFPALCGKQFLDLTGRSQNATGVAQTIHTASGTNYSLTFSVGNVVNPGGPFGTSSTVNVFVAGVKVLTATNARGSGKTHIVWKTFSKSFMAHGTSTTIKFVNGDPPDDTANGIDCISVS